MCVSNYEIPEQPIREVMLTVGVIFLLCIMIGILGNTVVLVIICKVLRSRRTVPNILILVLAVTDLLTICLAFPPALLKYFNGLDIGHAPLCNYQGMVLNFCYLISVALVACMSLDRYLALSRPFFYKNHVGFNCKKIGIALVVLCSLALVVSLLPVFGVGVHVLQYPRTFCLFQFNARDSPGRFIVFLNLVVLLFCMVTVVVCNSAVSWTSWRMLKRSREQRPRTDIEQTGSFIVCATEECQFLKLSVIVMATFVGFWSVFLIRVLMMQTGSPFNSCWDIISVHLVTFHTICNPWIYLLTRRQYRKGFWYIIQVSLHYISCKKLCLTERSLEHILGIPESKVSNIENVKWKVASKQPFVRSRSASLKQDQEDCDEEISTADRDL